MFVTNLKEFAKCRSLNDGERCRFFRKLPPLLPGFVPSDAPWFRPGAECEEVFPPDGLPRSTPHIVYAVEGAECDPNEHAVVGLMKIGEGDKATDVPFAWFSQSGEFVQGSDALKHYGINVEDDLVKNPREALESVITALETLCKYHKQVRAVITYDEGFGEGYRSAGNDTALMDHIRQFTTQD